MKMLFSLLVFCFLLSTPWPATAQGLPDNYTINGITIHLNNNLEGANVTTRVADLEIRVRQLERIMYHLAQKNEGLDNMIMFECFYVLQGKVLKTSNAQEFKGRSRDRNQAKSYAKSACDSAKNRKQVCEYKTCREIRE